MRKFIFLVVIFLIFIGDGVVLAEKLPNRGLTRYRNDQMGFEIDIFSDMKVDNYLNGIVTNIVNDKISISVFYDDFTNDLNTYNTYKDYSNNFFKG